MLARTPLRVQSVMVPELLESFPAPPSFIPPSPRTPLMPNSTPSNSSSTSSVISNPPPSLPPTGPLPPLPTGPSPITEEETLLFLSSASRLKRLSKLSICSTSSRRDSTATTTSVISNGSAGGCVPGLSPSLSGSSLSSSSSSSTSSFARIRTESVTSSHSLRSYPSSSSLSVMSASATHSHRLANSVDKSPPVRLVPPMEISITEEDDGVSASADLTAVTLDFLCSDADEDNGFAQFLDPPQSTPQQAVRKSRMTSPPPSSFKSPPRQPTSTRPQPFPNKESGPPTGATRGRTSPDIQTIISETPKPRRRRSPLLSNSSSREQSRSRAPSLKRQPQRSSAPSSIPNHTSSLRPAAERKLSLPDKKYLGVLDLEMDDSDMDRLERELEGDGTESDSSLDLHTPFAHVMLRDGLISPRSKVITALDTSTRPGSTISTASARTKTGLYKDDRDTLKRRTRHRDGRLLRGGVGLTTGLGWSDSEDEDSPSPLTRRLSSMALSRAPSVASIKSQSGAGPSPLSRTQSTISADGAWTRQSSMRSNNTLSTGSSTSARLPSTREDQDTEPPPLPPKDSLRTRSLPVRRPPSLPSSPGLRTLKSNPLKNTPNTSEFGVIDRPPLTQSVSSGPRPLKLMTSSSMLRSTSLGNSRLMNPAVRQTSSSESKNRINSVPSSTTVSPSPLLKSSRSLPKPVPVPSPQTPQVSSSSQDPLRPKPRTGTGMIYKKSGQTAQEFGTSSGLKRPMLTGIGGGVKGRGFGLPSPLRTGGSSEGSSPASSGVEFGIAL